MSSLRRGLKLSPGTEKLRREHNKKATLFNHIHRSPEEEHEFLKDALIPLFCDTEEEEIVMRHRIQEIVNGNDCRFTKKKRPVRRKNKEN